MITAWIHEEGAFSGLEELAETELSLGEHVDFSEDEEGFSVEPEEVDCGELTIESDCLHPRPA